MIDRAGARTWVRQHRWLVGGIAVAIGTLAVSAVLVVVASQAPQTATVRAAAHAHIESTGPDVNATPDTPGFSIPEISPGAASAAGGGIGGGNPGAPEPGAPAAGSAAPVASETVRETTPNPDGVASIAPEEEEHAGPLPVDTAVPFALPSGSIAGRSAVRFANGATEWLYTTPVSFADTVAFMRGQASGNGWKITGEPPMTTFPAPDGGTAQSQRIYVEQGAVRGYVIVTFAESGPGTGIQIDLIGL